MDMFANYGARGDAFAEAVHRSGRTSGHSEDGEEDRVSVTSETRRDGAVSSPGSPAGSLTGRPSVRRAMERPLTSYYLLLGGTTMLLAIGLMMVLSASSVYCFQVTAAATTSSSSSSPGW